MLCRDCEWNVIGQISLSSVVTNIIPTMAPSEASVSTVIGSLGDQFARTGAVVNDLSFNPVDGQVVSGKPIIS